MRTVFKTRYDQDIDLFRDARAAGWYGALVLMAVLAPWLVSEYLLGELTMMLLWAIAGMGLMLLTGHAGQPSLGHAAFLACGAYAEVWLVDRAGVPFLLALPLAGLFAGAVGALVAIPALRLSGIYLAIATLAIGIIVEDLILLASPVTGGVAGVVAPPITVFGFEIDRWARPGAFYGLTLLVAIAVTLAYRNLLRAPTGRAFLAIRDSELAARAIGVRVAAAKTLAFALSCCVTGLAGALLAHFLVAFNYELFLVSTSIQLLLMITVGGLASIHGAYLGAAVVVLLPQLITILRDAVAGTFGWQNTVIPGLETGLFAALIIAFVLLEPAGLYGRWLKIRAWFDLFPLARREHFDRPRSFLRTERMR